MRIYIRTFGCSSNRAESDAMEEELRTAGFEIVESPGLADAVLVNTCTVRGETELKVLGYVRGLAKTKKRVVVTGCMAAVQPALIARRAPDASIASPLNPASIAAALTSTSREVRLEPPRSRPPPEPAPFRGGFRYAVEIARGCLGECAYCIVRFARGRLRSLPPDLIVSRVSDAVRAGAKEIQLAAQDTSVYGRDIGASLPSLIDRIAGVEGDFKVRVGMFNPSSVAGSLGELVRSYGPKVYRFAHLPVQSGSDRVLALMNRGYRASTFVEITSALRSRHPELTIATDIMVGYPGEEDGDLQETLNLLERAKPDKIHVSRFSPRPHTSAASLRQVPECVKKRRSALVMRHVNDLMMRSGLRWVGRTVEAVVTGAGRKGGMIARTDEYRPVIIWGCDGPVMGKRLLVDIESCTPIYLRGRVSRR